jgi:hypothetical protein
MSHLHDKHRNTCRKHGYCSVRNNNPSQAGARLVLHQFLVLGENQNRIRRNGASNPLMAEFGKPGEPETFIPRISQETLAEMIGTTRFRVSFFMNRFRNLGLISYKDRIQVHRSLLNVVLLDQVSENNCEKPVIALP